MKAMVRDVDDHGKQYQVLAFVCPGCIDMIGGSGLHMIPVNTNMTSPAWMWDGNLNAPTVDPSILTHGRPEEESRCHSYLRGGVIEFLPDCTHALANQRVPLPDLPDWFVREVDG